MKYEVIAPFKDATDNKYRYGVGETYPRDGLEVTQERVDFLTSRGKLKAEKQDYTVKEIKALLDERKIDYPANAKKAELLNLLNEG